MDHLGQTKSTLTYLNLISAYGEAGNADAAIATFAKMKEAGVAVSAKVRPSNRIIWNYMESYRIIFNPTPSSALASFASPSPCCTI
jgi:pentatricopeptide repeat protein